MQRSLPAMPKILIIGMLMHPAIVQARGGHGGGGGGGGAHFGGGPVGRVGGPVARSYGPAYRGYPGHWGGSGWGNRGYRWGYPGYAWGYPYYGYGVGLGVGLGVGYGLSSGYAYGYPAYGYAAPVYAYPATGYVNSSSVVDTQPVAKTSSSSTADNTASSTNNSDASSVLTASASSSTEEAAAAASRSREFADRGTSAFKAGNYDRAAWSWRHAIVDDPQNPILVLRLSQALFAQGKYNEAAGAVQAAMRLLPKSEWGAVVIRYRSMYGKTTDYTLQLRALEKAIANKPNEPALRFLAAYHFGYLGFVKQSIEQLDHVIQYEPRDELARQLLDEMNNKLTPADSIPMVPPASSSSR